MPIHNGVDTISHARNTQLWGRFYPEKLRDLRSFRGMQFSGRTAVEPSERTTYHNFGSALRRIAKRLKINDYETVLKRLDDTVKTVRPVNPRQKAFTISEIEVKDAVKELKKHAVISPLDKSKGELFYECQLYFRYLLQNFPV